MAGKTAKHSKKLKSAESASKVRRTVQARPSVQARAKAKSASRGKVPAKPKALPKPAPRPRYPSEDDLERMVEEATVDAYNPSEQVTGFLTMLEQELALPFSTVVLGVELTVEQIDLSDDDRIIAVCRRAGSSQNLPLLDLPLPEPHPKGWEWIAAYRYWVR